MTETSALIGQTFGSGFVITGKLGEGGMGAVYRAVRRGREPASVAIKIPHPHLARNAAVRACFEREAETAARIDHPNTVRVLERGCERETPYLVMELVQGRDLFDVLSDAGRFPEVRAVRVALQICDAVATLHDRGIIHRDLKPENVMVSGDPEAPEGERIKLVDFGVAKWVGHPDPAAAYINATGSIVGTPAYMAPEQCLGQPADTRSDVYSCGAMLYHLVTGRPPFDDDCLLHMLFRHIYEPPRPPRQLVPTLDPDLEALIVRALAKRPEDRQQGAAALWEELLAILPRLEERSRQAGAPAISSLHARQRETTWTLPLLRKAPRVPASRSRRWGRVVAALTVVASIAGALLGWRVSSPLRRSADPLSSLASAVMLGP